MDIKYMSLELTYNKYKDTLYPVWEWRKPEPPGYSNFMPSVSKIRGYIKSFFSSQVKQKSQKRKVNKSMMNLMSLGGNDFRGVNPFPVTEAQTQKIVLVIKVSKAVSFIRDRILKVLSFRFLSA